MEGRFGNIQQLTRQSENWLSFFYAGISGCIFLISFFGWKGATVTGSHMLGSFFLFIFNCGSLSLIWLSPVHLSWSLPFKWNGDCRREIFRRLKHEQRLNTNPGTTVMLNQMCACTSQLVGLKRTDVILTTRLLHRDETITLSHVVSQCHVRLHLSK